MSKKWLFVSDVDDTLLGDDVALERLSAKLEKTADHIILAYNSSRPCASLRESLAAVPTLMTPDYLIGGLGTEIEIGSSGERLADYEQFLEQDWHWETAAELAAGLGAVPHPEQFQTPYKASFTLPDREAYRIVEARLSASGLAAKAIFTAGKFLDLIPIRAGKGEAIHFLRKWLKISAENVVVAGDSGNDIEMFVAPFRGIIVGNADEDLKQFRGPHIYQGDSPFAGGLLEGLRYWGVLEKGDE